MAIRRTLWSNGHDRNGISAISRSSISRGPKERAEFLQKKSMTGEIPGWIPWVGGAVGLCAVVYGLWQIGSVRNAIRGAAESIGEFFSGDGFDDEFQHGRYTSDTFGEDFGSSNFGSSMSEELRGAL